MYAGLHALFYSLYALGSSVYTSEWLRVTHIILAGEAGVATAAVLVYVRRDTQGPQGSHQLLVDLWTAGAAHGSAHTGQVTQHLTEERRGGGGGELTL